MDSNTLNDLVNKALIVAYNKTESKLFDQCALKEKHGANFERNRSLLDMYSTLIQDTGRFTEQSQSDLISIIKDLEKTLNNITEDSDPSIFMFGIHKNGVSDSKAIQEVILKDLNNIEHFIEHYRRIYAIKVSIDSIYGLRCVKIEIKDMTNTLPDIINDINSKIS